MIHFGKQQEILRDLSTSSPEMSCQETAGRLLIEDGIVVITNEKSAYRPYSTRRRSLAAAEAVFQKEQD